MTLPKRHILIVMPSLIGGGAEKTLINLLKKIDQSKYQIDLLVVLKKGVYVDQVPKGIKTIYLFETEWLVKVLTSIYRKFNILILFKYKIRLNKIKDYDVAISYLDSPYTDLLFRVSNVKRRITWIHASYISNQNFYQFFKNERYRNRIKRNRYDRLDKLIFVSHGCREEFEELFKVETPKEVLYNILDSKLIIEHSNFDDGSFEFQNGKTNVVAIGSLTKVKGFDKLVYAAREIIDRYKITDFCINILGDGPEREMLENLIDKKKVSSNVRLLGFKENPYSILKRSEIFVLSSISEALPTVICEAMILKKPIIATDCPGVRELLGKNEFGIISDHKVEILAEKMVSLIKDSNLRDYYAVKSFERSKIFNDKKLLKKYYSVFDI